jgi:hypothetical protein
MKINQTLPFLEATARSHCPSGLKGSFIRHQERRIQAETI